MAKRIQSASDHDLFETGSHVVARFELGPYATNCYVVASPRTPGRCFVVDASFDLDPMIEFIGREGLTPDALVLTHAHVDHIAGVRTLRSAFPSLPILIHAAEEAWLDDPLLNLSAFSGTPTTAPSATRVLAEGDRLDWGAGAWIVLHTPGHSPGSITLVHEVDKTAFVGDALFSGSIGRTDFPGCSFEALEASIRSKLYALDKDTTIFPGHGPESTIGRERRSNPFVHD
jgi:glyoxylase-like metal-dependent hydrolase (beta-lactamase superfamily II)